MPSRVGRVKVSYRIAASESTIAPDSYCRDAIEEAHDKWVSLEELLPGFALGLFGMQIGETAQLWIHPALGYEPEALFEPGATLIAEVHLLDFDLEDQEYGAVDNLLQPPPCRVDPGELARLEYLSALYEGYRLWDGLQKVEDVLAIEGVLRLLQQLAEGAEMTLDPDNAWAMCRQVRWLAGYRLYAEIDAG